MARRSYRQRRRFRRARWAPSIQEIAQTHAVQENTNMFFAVETLMKNADQVNYLVSQVYTVKNIECTFNIESVFGGTVGSDADQQYLEDFCVYIMYVPQGMTVTEDYNLQHPEYIMAYKYIGSPTNDFRSDQQYQPVRVKTRLSRKLQTGDGVILFVKGRNQNNSLGRNIYYRISGLVRWWTKAN